MHGLVTTCFGGLRSHLLEPWLLTFCGNGVLLNVGTLIADNIVIHLWRSDRNRQDPAIGNGKEQPKNWHGGADRKSRTRVFETVE